MSSGLIDNGPAGTGPTGRDPAGSAPTSSDPTGSGPLGAGPLGAGPAGVRDGGVRPVCVLIGAPGAGKTTVGELLATRLEVAFTDVDAVIEVAAGKPIPDIFIDEGEDYFRTLEREAVLTALTTFGGVLALGGGAILAEATRDALAGHTVIYLSVELSDAIRRVGLGQGRPLLAVNPRATLKYLMDQRRPLYEKVATRTVLTDGRTPEEIVGEILTVLR